ncbi:hypothetical protein Lal_00030268 [Lupinus albus]|nr:hypothetical protein Lal_00030268 [Lupinus albus]
MLFQQQASAKEISCPQPVCYLHGETSYLYSTKGFDRSVIAFEDLEGRAGQPYLIFCLLMMFSFFEKLSSHRMTQNFVWGDDARKPSINPVKSDIIAKPKWHGGLGLRNSRSIKTSLLEKLSWSMISDYNKL